MAQKRKANDAFGNGQEPSLSAFAVAQKLRQNQNAVKRRVHEPEQVGTPLPSNDQDINLGSKTKTGTGTPTETLRLQPDDEDRLPSVTIKNVVAKTEKSLEIALKVSDKITLTGEYDLNVMQGVVEIYGATVSPKSGTQRIFALNTQALPSVIGRTDTCVVKIHSVSSQLKVLEKFSPLFRNIWLEDEAEGFSFALRNTQGNDVSQSASNELDIDDDIRKTLTRITGKTETEAQNGRSARVMAIGSKSTGKSTLNRLLCNHILTRSANTKCMFLDLDPGQPEFGTPGQVSLVEILAPVFGPSFSHIATSKSANYRLLRSHTLAATSFKDFPDHYLTCATDLIQRVPKSSPVIVNSCGWVSGVGANVLVDLASCLGITDIVVLGIVDDGLASALRQRVDHVHRINRQQTRSSTRSPAELRAMQSMSYFHLINHGSTPSLRWISRSISTFRPWIVSYSGLRPGITAVLSYSQSVHPDYLAEVLDGSIVALVVVQQNGSVDSEPSILRTSIEDIPYFPDSSSRDFLAPIDPYTSHCAGLALIRAIDSDRKVLHLVTPLPESQVAELANQQVYLVRGGFDCPEWAYLEDAYSGTSKPRISFDDDSVDQMPWVSYRERVGVEGAVWRLRHPPTAASMK